VTLGNRFLIRKSKPLPFNSLKIFAYWHLFRQNVKARMDWLHPCDAEQLQFIAGQERSGPARTTEDVSSPALFVHPYI